MFKKNKEANKTFNSSLEKQNKPKKPMPIWLKRTIIIASSIAAIIIIIISALLISAAMSPQNGIEAFIEPVASEAQYINNMINDEGFSININGSKSYTSVQYDGRTGDLSAEVTQGTNEQPSTALYFRENMLVYKLADDSVYYQTDSDITPDKLPISINDRILELWKEYKKQSNSKNMLKPYNKILKKAKKNMTKTSGKQTLELLGKDKNVTANIYTLNSEQSGELLDQLLDQFAQGDKLYNFMDQLYEQSGEQIFDGCATMEDSLDLIDDFRRSIITEQGSITWVQYKKGGLFGIGRHVVADKITISTLGDDPCTFELFAMGYSKSSQQDKQLYFTHSKGGNIVKQFEIDYTAVKSHGQLNITGTYMDNIFADGVNISFNGTSDTAKDITTTSLDIDFTQTAGIQQSYSCSLDSELNGDQMNIYLDWIDDEYDITLKNTAGNPVFPNFDRLNANKVEFADIFGGQNPQD